MRKTKTKRQTQESQNSFDMNRHWLRHQSVSYTAATFSLTAKVPGREGPRDLCVIQENPKCTQPSSN